MASQGKGGSGKRYENPPPKTSRPVKHEAGEALRGGNKTERSLAGSVERHIEPRKRGALRFSRFFDCKNQSGISSCPRTLGMSSKSGSRHAGSSAYPPVPFGC
jgi:hypothetical protein